MPSPVAGRVAGWIAIAWLLPPAAGGAEPAPAADPGGYDLLHPTPRDQLRPLDPAAADVTETPYTVDPGHLQVESVLVGYARDQHRGETSQEWLALGTALRLGLTEDLDAELRFTAYRHIDPGGPSPVADGFGDLELRLKGNLWGNGPEPGRRTAAGWIAALTVPTGTEPSSDHVEGRVFLPAAWHVSDRLAFQATLEFDFFYDSVGGDHDTALVHSGEAVFQLSEPFGTYLEYVGRAAVEGGADYQAQLGSGLTWLLGENAALDVGGHAGLNAAAPVVTTTLTLTLRF